MACDCRTCSILLTARPVLATFNIQYPKISEHDSFVPYSFVVSNNLSNSYLKCDINISLFFMYTVAIFSLSDSLFISSTPNTSMVFRVFPWSVRNIAGLYFFSISVSTIYLILIPISNVIGGSLSCLLLCKNRLYKS